MGMRSRAAGLSLVELMITILVMAMLMAYAIPRFRDVMARGDVVSATNSLTADMQFARGQAASQHRYVSICRSTTGTECAEAITEPYDYDAGWMVYSYDVSEDGPNQTYTTAKGNMDILRYTPKMKGVSLRATNGKLFTFNQTGQFLTATGRTQISFAVCSRIPSEQNTDHLGTNESGKQGSLLVLRASGSLTVTPLPLTSSCLP